MKTVTRKKLARNVSHIMSERIRRLSVLRKSTILDNSEVDVGEETVRALRTLEENPRRILHWISEEELALYSSMEDM